MLIKSDVVEIIKMERIRERDINMYNIYKGGMGAVFIRRRDKLLDLDP